MAAVALIALLGAAIYALAGTRCGMGCGGIGGEVKF
jgi:hypothetical protein